MLWGSIGSSGRRLLVKVYGLGYFRGIHTFRVPLQGSIRITIRVTIRVLYRGLNNYQDYFGDSFL